MFCPCPSQVPIKMPGEPSDQEMIAARSQSILHPKPGSPRREDAGPDCWPPETKCSPCLTSNPNHTDMVELSRALGQCLLLQVWKLSPGMERDLSRAPRKLMAEMGPGPQLKPRPEARRLADTLSCLGPSQWKQPTISSKAQTSGETSGEHILHLGLVKR